MAKIRVLIADDHEMVRKGIRKALEEQSDIDVLDEAADGAEAVKKIMALCPDIAVIDIAMPRLSGLNAARVIKNTGSNTRIIILSIYKKDAYVYQAFVSGALGYVLKPTLAQNIIDGIRTVYRGDYFLSPKIDSEFIHGFLKKMTHDKNFNEHFLDIDTTRQ
ncbi:Signal transduction response regulator, receiver domain-containing protein [Desulfonema limicola]|uniref:Signal transduction response regulator, receiver domain-containing protein n=1 Tax=Desulfonema limicola TaxID=45656 RepID=A0A975GIA1_9BACT|nr:response regulator transcription factor [Desulfonema limicola]QTA82094.1 Signal transduction response regulator, receiver domain-containing protein [Desulfonema limicola]